MGSKKKKTSKSSKDDDSEDVPEIQMSLDAALKQVKDTNIDPNVKVASKSTKNLGKKATMDVALMSSKKTQTDLQGMLQGNSEGTEWYRRVKGEEKIDPKLIYESKIKLAEDYAMEDIPIPDRQIQKNIAAEKKPEAIATPEPKGETIYSKLQIFFNEFIKGYNERYNRWEDSISNILAILRKMRKYTKKNTEDLVSSIKNVFNQINISLEEFKIKRDEIEKIAGVDVETMSGEFKKVLGMLELQIKEYQLKLLTDELIKEQKRYI